MVPSGRPDLAANWLEIRDQGHLLGNQATYDAFRKRRGNCIGGRPTRDYSPTGWTPGGATAPSHLKPIGKMRSSRRWKSKCGSTRTRLISMSILRSINAYSLLHSQGIYEGQRAVTEKQTCGEPHTSRPTPANTVTGRSRGPAILRQIGKPCAGKSRREQTFV